MAGGLKQFLEGCVAIADGVERTQEAMHSLRRGRKSRGQVESRGQVIDVNYSEVLPPSPLNPQGGPPSGMTVTHKTVKTIDERVSYIIQMIQKGRDSAEIRRFAVQAISKRCGDGWCTPEGDGEAEVRALFAACQKVYRYCSDTHGKDLFQHPERTLEFGGGDCFPEGSRVLTSDYRIAPIESLSVGQKIWGLDRWSEVTAKVYKGLLPVHGVMLNNGSWLRLTANHRVTVAHCDRHRLDRKGGPCSCPLAERKLIEMPVSELAPGMVLVQPEKIPTGSLEMDPDRAWVEGLYLSDGSSGHNTRFDIAGQDGCPKEKQKRDVEEICARLGIATNWHRKYISVKDAEWTLRMHQMGRHAPAKQALDIGLHRDAAMRLLEGIMADSGANTNGSSRTITTTSYELALQARVLHRMMGTSCGWSYIENHGGLGTNPIYRLFVRGDHSAGRMEKLLRVRAVEENIHTVPCWDITTDDHYVYLPEADVTVNQCDDATILICSALGSVGFDTKARVIQTTNAKEWNHIYALVGLPQKSPSKWVALDLSVSSQPPGWQPPANKIARIKDFDIPLVR